ncbi:amino acid adenylation domain-containing protein [Allokutzneria oryzae]|uniref:Amino acid adenylation domain-containing protein n=1 Tax=Allokutzneria oryzae TaxID=1378989 RepID=A0ABV5ZXI1_9PSEU
MIKTGLLHTDHLVPVQALVAAHAAKHPAAVAVVGDGRGLSFGELDAWSNRLAGHLRERGVTAETPVAVCVPRSAEFVVALLAVLKAGGAYLTLDPEAPSDRTAAMIADAGCPVALVVAATAGRLGGCVEVAVDADLPVAGNDHSATTSADQAACLFYTSGSTGRPKGVVVTHGNLAAFVRTPRWDHAERRVTALVSALGFDAVTYDLWPTLARGGTVVIPSSDRLDTHVLAELVAEHGITDMFLTSVWFAQVAAVQPDCFLGVRSVMAGGDVVSPQAMTAVMESCPGLTVSNVYGPTECTTFSTVHDLIRAPEGSVPIGIGLPGVRVRVLDENLIETRDGEVGEIYIGGPQVARGYLGQQALTATRFVADPYGLPGSRMYRTGDLARRRADGVLEFAGRNDDQVKIRGHRIEPGEVEAVVGALPGVTQAAVLVRDKQLVAYVVGAHDEAGVREDLGRALPDYMVPSAIVLMDRLPMTANGKLDRAALPQPTRPQTTAGRAPTTREEQVITSIFAEVLGLASVGVDDDFFHLGGDSITAMHVVSRARREDVALTSQDVFRYRSAAGLAATAAKAVAPQADLLHQSATGPVGMPPIMHWLRDQRAGVDEFNHAVLLETPADATQDRLVAALQALLDHHDALRMRVPRLAGGAVWTPQIVAPGEVDAATCLSTVDIRGIHDLAEVVDAARVRVQGELDPQTGAMVRAVWFDAGDAPGRLLLMVHHIVVDGVSWRIMLPDLARAYAGKSLLWGGSAPYRQWVEELTGRANDPALLDQLTDWCAVLDAPVRPWSQPLDPARDTIGTSETLTITLPADVTRALLTEAPAHLGGTTEEVLLTALAVAVGAWRGDDTLLFDTESHGRGSSSLEVSSTVGWFTSMFPARLTCRDTAPARMFEVVRREWRALPEDTAGYGLLRHLNPQTAQALAFFPPRPLLFNYLGRFSMPGESWPLAAEAPLLGIHRADDMPLSHLLEVNSAVDDRTGEPEFTATWRWTPRLLDRDSVQELAGLWTRALERLAGVQSRPAGEVWPVSPLQEGLLFHAAHASGAPDPYAVQTFLELSGPVDAEALRTALNQLLVLHPALRAGFHHDADGRAVQTVPPTTEFPLQVVDLTHLPAARRPAELERVAAEDRARQFDLAAPPLLRAVLVRSDTETWRLILSYHHVLMDGWSMQVMLADLAALYSGADVPSRPSGRAYLEDLLGRERTNALTAWRNLLTGVDEPTLLTPVHSGPFGELPATETVALPEDVTTALRAQAQRGALSLNTLVLGAWGLTLAQLTGRTDVVFGTVVADRPPHLDGVEQMVSLMNNAVPVRIDTATHDTWAGLLAGLQEQRTELMAHQHLGLAEITQATGLRELFDSVVVLETYTDAFIAELGRGVSVTRTQVNNGTHYPLCLLVSPGKQITVRVQHQPGWLRPDAARAIGQRLLDVLSAMANNLERSCATPALTAAPAPTSTDVTAAPPVLDRIRAHAPEAIAIRDSNGSVTYGELDEASTRLAHVLISRGIRPESVVALCLRRGRDAVTAMLAVLKAGGAYLHLDPRHPAERLARLVADTRPALLLSHQEFASALSEVDESVPSLHFDSADALAGSATTTPEVVVRDEHPAYVVHTSGTQGVPKAVVFTVGALNKLVDWHEQRFPAEPDAVTAQFTSMAFDVATQEVFTALAAGKTLAVPDADTRADAAAWTKWLRDNEVTELFAPTPVLAALCEFADGERETLPKLRHIVQAGEALVLTEQMRALCAGKALHNHYGPAETHVVTAVHVDGEPESWPHRPSIGAAVPGTRVHLLDAGLVPVPDGLVGEIYLGGPQVARGYLGKPALTSSRFVPDPYGPPGSRMYRTGDLARRGPDGSLEFLGRNDDQVKIRGHRIEPAEVQAAVSALPGVVQAAVVAHTDERGGKRLTAYVVSTGTGDAASVREQLSTRLPDFMVPSAVVFLDRMPLTTNGKVDRRALPAPPDPVGDVSREPRTYEETVITKAFAEVLGVPVVGVEDDFFHLGGHSLLAARLLQRLRDQLGRPVELAQIMALPTPAALAAELS